MIVVAGAIEMTSMPIAEGLAALQHKSCRRLVQVLPSINISGAGLLQSKCLDGAPLHRRRPAQRIRPPVPHPAFADNDSPATLIAAEHVPWFVERGGIGDATADRRRPDSRRPRGASTPCCSTLRRSTKRFGGASTGFRHGAACGDGRHAITRVLSAGQGAPAAPRSGRRHRFFRTHLNSSSSCTGSSGAAPPAKRSSIAGAHNES